MTNNIKVNKDKAIFKLIYKICNHQKGGTCFDIVLLINTATNEVLGMGKLQPTLPKTQHILCNLSGNWSFINANADDGIHISVEGKFIDRTNQDGQSRKNAEINLSLEKDWRSGIASFKYLLDKEWVHGGYAQIELEDEQGLPSIINNTKQTQSNLTSTLH